MHLRVSEEAEKGGLDLDQFFDEQIGDWGMFAEYERRKQEMGMGAREGEPVMTEGVERDAEMGATKKVVTKEISTGGESSE